jgi:hypothetical protein
MIAFLRQIACLLLIYSTISACSSVVAQDLKYRDFKWEETPQYKIPHTTSDDAEVVIKERVAIEFAFHDNAFNQYEFAHRVVYIAKESAIEQNNKIFLSVKNSHDVLIQQARVINAAGEIKVLNESDIKEGVDEEVGYTYRYFALEGLDVGSFIETVIMIKGPADHTGNKHYIQSDVKQYDVGFELISPEVLVFAFHSLNGLKEVQLDTTHSDKNFWSVHLDSVEKYVEEPLSFTYANLQAVIFKLSENHASGARDMASYGEAAKSYYNYLYGDISKSERNAIQSFLKKIGVEKGMSNAEKVRLLENHVKEYFAMKAYVQPELQGVVALLKNKASDERSFVQLYARALKLMEIEHQIVLTCDRTMNRFDRKFEAHSYLESTLFYLNQEQLFLSPAATGLRLGYVPWEFTENYGLFIQPLTIGQLTTGIGKIKKIPALDHDKSQYNHNVKVDMREDPTAPTIRFETEMSGYYAAGIQTIYKYLSEEEKTKVNEGLLQTFSPELIDEELTVENAEPALFGKEPMVISTTAQSYHFTEEAGNKIVFKIGELIGEQSEMYNEKPRTLPIESDYNRSFYRSIEVLLPDGYTVTNLEKLNSSIETEDKSSVFHSSYTLENNVLKVTISEYYNRIHYSLDEYEAYKSVINAAADFNKVVLYLDKK